jgi:hypothetical protein
MDFLMDTVSMTRPSVKSGRIRCHAAFIQKHNAFRVYVRDICPPLLAPPHSLRAIRLTGVQTFFTRGPISRITADSRCRPIAMPSSFCRQPPPGGWRPGPAAAPAFETVS